MTEFSTVLDNIFDRDMANPPMERETERMMIAEAKLGDSSATIALLYSYAYELRKTVSGYRAAGGGWGQDEYAREELRAAATLGFMEAIHSFDGTRWDRLAAILKPHLSEALSSSLSSPVAFSIPQRTLTRFYSILRKADNNPYEAAALAPKYEMKTETFLAVLSALRDVGSYDQLLDSNTNDERGFGDVEAFPLWDNSHPDAEDEVLVEAAFSAVDTLEKDVVRLRYGFVEYDPVPDGEIAARMGLSRQKVQRTASSALTKMRDALGVA
jgi:DNA-directed RNA polymerase specialized sigma subunit